MLQKILKVGNSLAVTLPAEFIKAAKIKAGDTVGVEYNAKLKWFLAKSKKEADKTTLTPEFKNWLDNFMEEYRPILKRLSHL